MLAADRIVESQRSGSRAGLGSHGSVSAARAGAAGRQAQSGADRRLIGVGLLGLILLALIVAPAVAGRDVAATPRPSPIARRPAEGSCLGPLDGDVQLAEPVDSAPVVSCPQPHSAEVFHVGSLAGDDYPHTVINRMLVMTAGMQGALLPRPGPAIPGRVRRAGAVEGAAAAVHEGGGAQPGRLERRPALVRLRCDSTVGRVPVPLHRHRRGSPVHCPPAGRSGPVPITSTAGSSTARGRTGSSS